MSEIFPDITIQEAVIEELTSVKGPGDIITKTYTEIDRVQVYVYNKSATEGYFSVRWSSDVTDIMLGDPPINITNTCRVTIAGKTYEAEVPLDVGNLEELIMAGLKRLS